MSCDPYRTAFEPVPYRTAFEPVPYRTAFEPVPYRTAFEPVPAPRLRFEIDDDTEVAARLRALHDAQQSVARAYRAEYDALPEVAREGRPLPLEESLDRMFERVLLAGAGSMLYARPPNSVICAGLPAGAQGTDDWLPSTRAHKKGAVCTTAQVCIPIGTEIIALETSREDGPNWDVVNLYFANMNLVNPQGSFGGVPLSTFRFVTRNDLLSMFDQKRTKVDVIFSATLACKRDGATFGGFRLHVFQDEQLCAIGCRVEDVSCEHPAEYVRPILYVDCASPQIGYVSAFTRERLGSAFGVGTHHAQSQPMRPRYRCTLCRHEVVRVEVAPVRPGDAFAG